MKAHTTNKLVDKRYIKEKESYKNLDDIQQQRGSQIFQMSDEDEKAIKSELDKEKQYEFNRQINIKKHDKNVTQHFEKINKIMVKNK